MNRTNLMKGDWRKVATTERPNSFGNMLVHTLWTVTLKCGETHEVVTACILGDEIIEEVDGVAEL